MEEGFKLVTIHLSRLGKPKRLYQEGLMEDDGIRLKTFSIVSESVGLHLSTKFCQQGWVLQGRQIRSVHKYHFYKDFFSIVAYHDREDRLLGYYCDIVTPLQKINDEYFLTDLILDVWISPNLQVTELDQDEFEAAIGSQLFTFNRLKAEVIKGIFAGSYLS